MQCLACDTIHNGDSRLHFLHLHQVQGFLDVAEHARFHFLCQVIGGRVEGGPSEDHHFIKIALIWIYTSLSS